MWKFYAILSAFFAAATAILAKIGIKGVSGNLATAVRTIIILFIAWGIISVTGEVRELKTLTKNNLLFLGLSGIATGLSWIFYFKALETGEVSKVAPIDKLSVAIGLGLAFLILKEPIEIKTLIGATLIIAVDKPLQIDPSSPLKKAPLCRVNLIRSAKAKRPLCADPN